MIKSNRDIIQELQTDLLQDFFEIQMMAQFQDTWKEEVRSVAVQKQNFSFVYDKMKKKFDAKGVGGITVKDFDVTSLAALIRFDFCSVCCPDNHTNISVGHIAMDRNDFSHISNYKDIQHIFDIEKTSVDNMTEFLTHLKNIAWNHPVIFRKYLGTGHGDGSLNEIARSVESEQNGENRIRSSIRHYMQELTLIREDRTAQYVGLSYNSDGRRDEKKLLDELIEDNLINSQTGMRIAAEGGYGKSWTLSEIAGRFAQLYLDNDTGEQLTIPILIEMGKLYRDCSSVSKKIAQLFFDGKEEEVPGFYKSNKILLLIDAMDEAKADIQGDVSRELASLHETHPNIVFVCASRKSCIDKYPVTIPCYAIRELDDGQIVDYMTKVIPEDFIESAKRDWVGGSRKEFLSRNRTPFYLSCYVELICETRDNIFFDTTQLIGKFLDSVITREIRKTGFNSDRATFINFLRELCRLLDSGSEDGERVTALPEIDVIRELTSRIPVEEGQASVKAVGRKLVEMQILARDEDEMLISFAHQNYKEYINRKYPERTRMFRSWQ